MGSITGKGTRRGHGEGTVSRRSDGRWEARVSLSDGTRKSFYAKTRQEAQTKLRQAQSDIERGLPLADEQQTVATYLTGWLETIAPTVRPSTLRRHQEFVTLHILPTLGRVKLARLTPQMAQTLYTAKLREKLSSTTVHHLHATLHKALAAAVRLGLIPRNVSELVDRPRMQPHPVSSLTAEEARTLLDAVRGDRLAALYTLALSTGMRQGELLALRWRDVDLSGALRGDPRSASLQVRASLAFHRETVTDAATGLTTHPPLYQEPKTRRSRRRIALNTQVVAALRAHRTAQKLERLHAGAAWQGTGGDGDLVFCDEIGQPLQARNVIRMFARLLDGAGVRRIRFHDLRHTCATLLLMARVNPKVVSEMLGHSSVGITLDIYSHVLPEMQQDAADVMGQVLRDPREVALELDRERTDKRDGSED